ncbi:MAG: hypothetical protein R3275_03490 [Saprospiraceae bacterium]|nr:hypothetical protein [Saprospiraceae bacterium]
MWKLICSFLVLSALFACQQAPGTSEGEENVAEEEDVVLAEVYGTQLKLSDLSLVVDSYDDSKDSLAALKTAINRWVKDKLLLHEATENIPEDLDIDKLVKEYRESLIRHHYEQKLVSSQLDTVITEFDLMNHYEENKSRYTLEKSIIRCLYIKVRKPVRSIKRIEEWLDEPTTANLVNMRQYCTNYAEFCLVNPDKWYKWEDVKQSFPKQFKVKDLKAGNQRTFADFEHQYFIKILEFVSKKNEAPLSYFEEQAEKLIIRERKNRLLEELKSRLYEEAKGSQNVKIYIE